MLTICITVVVCASLAGAGPRHHFVTTCLRLLIIIILIIILILIIIINLICLLALLLLLLLLLLLHLLIIIMFRLNACRSVDSINSIFKSLALSQMKSSTLHV